MTCLHCFPFANMLVHLRFYVGSAFLIFLVFCVVFVLSSSCVLCVQYCFSGLSILYLIPSRRRPLPPPTPIFSNVYVTCTWDGKQMNVPYIGNVIPLARKRQFAVLLNRRDGGGPLQGNTIFSNPIY